MTLRKYKVLGPSAIVLAMAFTLMVSQPAFAADSDVAQVENFIKNIIKVVAGLAGLVAAGFFVVGGFGYITSSGHPERLDRSKQTLIWSGVGLAIVVAAFVISNIITDIATGAFGK